MSDQKIKIKVGLDIDKKSYEQLSSKMGEALGRLYDKKVMSDLSNSLISNEKRLKKLKEQAELGAVEMKKLGLSVDNSVTRAIKKSIEKGNNLHSLLQKLSHKELGRFLSKEKEMIPGSQSHQELLKEARGAGVIPKYGMKYGTISEYYKKRADYARKLVLEIEKEEFTAKKVLATRKEIISAEKERQKIEVATKKQQESDDTEIKILNLKERIKNTATDIVAQERFGAENSKERENILRKINELQKQIKDGNVKDVAGAQQKLAILKKEFTARNSIQTLVNKNLANAGKELKEQAATHQTILQKMRDAARSAFTMDKIFNRMAFVLTAKMSYQAFDFVNRSLREGVQNAIKLEAQLVRIASISRGQDQRPIKQAVARSMGLGFTAEDAVGAAYKSVSAQFSIQDTAKLLDVSSKMAVAGFVNQTEALDLLTTAIRSYQLDVNSATNLSDKFFRTIELGKVTVGELSQGLGVVSASANVLGINIDEVLTAISTMTMAGVQANKAFTSLNQLFLNLAKPSSEAAKIFEKYGVSVDLSEIKVNGFANTMRKLIEAQHEGRKLTEQEMATIAGSRRGFIALATALGQNVMWQDNYNKMVDAGGYTQQAFNEQMETADMKLKRLHGAFMQLGASIGETLGKGVVFVDGFITPLMKGLDGLIATIGTAVIAFTLLGKTIQKLGLITKQNLAIMGTLALLGTVAYFVGKRKEDLEKLEKFQKDIAEKENTRIQTEIDARKKQNELLATYIHYKEMEARGVSLSKAEATLLNTVQGKLAETYQISSDKIEIYNEKLTEGLKIQKELRKEQLENTIKTKEFSMRSKSLPAYKKDRAKDSKAMRGTLTTGGHVQTMRSMNIDNLQESFRILDTVFSQYEWGDYEDAKTRLDLFDIQIDSIFERIEKRRKVIQDKLKKGDISPTDAIDAEKTINAEIRNYKDILKSVNKQTTELRELLSLRLNEEDIKPNIITPSASEIEEEKIKNRDHAWALAKKQFELGEISINDLITAQEAYSEKVTELTDNKTEQEKLQATSRLELYNLTDKRLSENIKAMEQRKRIAKTENEYEKIQEELDDLYKDRLDTLSEMTDSESAKSELELQEELRKAEKDINVILFQRMQANKEKKEQDAELAKLSEEQLGLTGIAVDANKMSIKQLEKWLSDNQEILENHKELADIIRKIISKRQKIIDEINTQVQKEQELGLAGEIGANIFGRESELSIRKQKIQKSEDLPDAQKKEMLDEIEVEENKKHAQTITDHTKQFLSQMTELYDAYLNRRLEQIEAEKAARIDAIDTQAKEEYRSSLWVEREKAKVDKQAEAEKRKTLQRQQQVAIGETIVNSSVGMVRIWKDNPAWLAIPLMAMLAAITATSIANISAQKFEKGGLVGGKRHRDGGTIIEAEKGEFVFSRKATVGNEKFLYTLQNSLETKSLNRVPSQNIASIPNNPVINNQFDTSGLSKKLDSVADSIRQVSLVVEMHGQYIDDVQLARRVDAGNSRRRKF